jgi:hypothetical protein
MDHETMKTAIEAQFLMGHCVPSAHVAMDNTTITGYSWNVDQVRQQLHVPLNALWEQRVFALEVQGLASFSFYVAPLIHDEEGHEHEVPGWQDQAREQWGSVGIHPRGVLRLAELYGRPYVKLEESPALLEHWQLVQAESAARVHAPYDPAQWEREWPERALLRKAREAGEGDSG